MNAIPVTTRPSSVSPDLVVQDIRPWGGPPVDLHVTAGTITDLVPRTGTQDPTDISTTRVVDGAGAVALPGFVNAHAHVDKSWWGEDWVPYGGGPGVPGRIAHERERRGALGIPGPAPTRALLRQMLATGTTAIRSHVDVDTGIGLQGMEVVQEAVADLDGAVEVEIVAFPQDGVLRRPGVADLLDRAATAGAHHIGGLDPASIDRDPVGQIDLVFGIAERHGIGVDIHLHDGGELGAFQVELMIDRTRRTGLQGKVNVAHGFALGDLPDSRRAGLLEGMAEVGISLTTVAAFGRPAPPLSALTAAGIPVGLGTDGVRDLWTPYGTGDLLQQSTQLARMTGARDDDTLVRCARIATSGGAWAVSRDVHDLVVGARADLVLVDARNTQDSVVRAPERSLVVSGGRIVAQDGETLV
ncbi:amidohydrolase [Brevibacterium litoralis]|uniref:amidohydrolase n=1 Tax=Brevibacterium litoralis TaxID=3138935 RepID=UPI0032EF76FE